MDEYIERKELLKRLQNSDGNDAYTKDCGFGTDRAVRIVVRVPTADVAPVVHGEWIEDGYDFYICSNCRDLIEFYSSPYCPNCGAKMDGGKK